MNGYVTNLSMETLENDDFRRVLFTAKRSQLVVMSLDPGEEIGAETHEGDQIIRIEAGFGTAKLEDEEHSIAGGSIVFIPGGTEHNIINISDKEELKLYAIYAPPEHKNGTVHSTKEQAEERQEKDKFKGE